MEGVLVAKFAMELVVGPKVAVGMVVRIAGQVRPDLVVSCAGRRVSSIQDTSQCTCPDLRPMR